MRWMILLLTVSSFAWSADLCAPMPTIRSVLEHAAGAASPDPADFEGNVGPFRVLRQEYPNDLFVHERYQDAVQQHGIEGHLRKLTEEYQSLLSEHPDDVVYEFLFQRTMIGRNTPSAIQGMRDILQSRPDFMPAHGALAEVYSTTAFRDDEKAKSERGQFSTACPTGVLAVRPTTLPDPSPLIEQAEKMQASGDAEQALNLATKGLRADEWRLQRIRPFDWYSVDYKRSQQIDLQEKYWRVWALEVRVYRQTRETEKVNALLRRMEERAIALRNDTDNREGDLAPWNAYAVLARLYAEGGQRDLAEQKLDSMRQLLIKHPDISRASQVEDLQKTISLRP